MNDQSFFSNAQESCASLYKEEDKRSKIDRDRYKKQGPSRWPETKIQKQSIARELTTEHLQPWDRNQSRTTSTEVVEHDGRRTGGQAM
jgi:hypothetical protein